MAKTNQFSDRFSSKTSEELKQITQSTDYSEDAKLAAIWELERRNESTEEQTQLSKKIIYRKESISHQRREERKYRTFWPRVLASLIDMVVIFIITIFPSMLRVGLNSFSYHWAWDLLLNLLVLTYYIRMHGEFGQTLGKMAMGIKVVRVSDEGPINYKQAAVRDIVPISMVILSTIFYLLQDITGFELWYWQVYILENIWGIWGLAEIITMLTNKKRRAIHDFMAKTVVIRSQ